MESLKEYQLHLKFWRVILALVVVNILILLLKNFNLNTYIIIIGFRCHISLILPIVLIFSPDFLPFIKRNFLHPEYKKAFVFLTLILLPILIVLCYLFFTHNIDLGDPDYFYEFGVSSVADYPVYLLWNFPQIVLLFFFLTAVSTTSKYRFLTVFFTVIFLFGSELLLPVHSPFPYSDLGILISCSAIVSILINYYPNIYWFCISLFTMLWLPLLAFGSNSKTLVNILYASQYKYWDGFFDVSKIFAPYSVSAYFGFALIIGLTAFIFRKKTENLT